MGSVGASLTDAESAAALATRVLHSLVQIRGEQEHPALYPMLDHPWTDHFARLVRDDVHDQLSEPEEGEDIHVVAAHWRSVGLLAPRRVRAGEHPLYDLAWRVYPADGGRLLAQRLIAECIWKGGWPALARACDRLAQARSDVKLITTMEDPSRKVGDMMLAEACAFRINAFAPAGDHVMLAFYGSGGADSWRQTPGFAFFDYVTGENPGARAGGLNAAAPDAGAYAHGILVCAP